MTVKELKEELSKYNDDQYVNIRLHNDSPWGVDQLFIQSVEPCEPWRYDGDESKLIVGIHCHEYNRIIK